MTVRIVTERPALQSGTFTNAYTVKNAGSATVYLGQDSSLMVGSHAFSLTSGATLVWRGETELWAVTKQGESTELEVLYDASSAFTPGPDHVTATIDGPVTVSGSVGINGDVAVTGDVGITGPVDINGDVTVTNSELNIEGAVFSRPSSQPIPIDTVVYPVPAAQVFTPSITPFYDVSDYSSIIVKVYGINTRAFPDWQDTVETVVIQTENPAGNITMTKRAVFLLRASFAGMQASFQVPVTAKYMAVQTLLRKLANAGGFPAGTMTIEIAGSHEVITDVRYVQQDDNMLGDIATGGIYTRDIAGAGTSSEYVSVANGAAVLNVGNLNTNTINANCLVYTINAARSGLQRITSGFIPTGFNDTVQRQFYVPCRPVQVVLTSGAGSGITVSINK